MPTVFDRHVDERLLADALAPAAFGSMWLDPELLDSRPVYQPLTGDARCDLLVVGGGYTGLWAALHAVERDRFEMGKA